MNNCYSYVKYLIYLGKWWPIESRNRHLNLHIYNDIRDLLTQKGQLRLERLTISTYFPVHLMWAIRTIIKWLIRNCPYNFQNSSFIFNFQFSVQKLILYRDLFYVTLHKLMWKIVLLLPWIKSVYNCLY